MTYKKVGAYTLYECTAIAYDAGDTEPQPALFCRGEDDECHDGDCVIFGWKLSWITRMEDVDEGYSTSEEVLRSVRIDGQPLSALAL